jgi:hypothetical protein
MRPTRSSLALKDAKRRLERLKSINPMPDFGAGFNFDTYEKAVMELQELEGIYNTTVSELDTKLVQLKEKEKVVKDFRGRILAAIAVKFGKNSDEYVAAGGTKLSERKRSSKRQTSTPQKNGELI